MSETIELKPDEKRIASALMNVGFIMARAMISTAEEFDAAADLHGLYPHYRKIAQAAAAFRRAVDEANKMPDGPSQTTEQA
jgi:hypothetical protein